jgi:2,4-dienoyl-CoA reductase-like NADH-dependent reductase (Old Yellow Enzyme family)
MWQTPFADRVRQEAGIATMAVGAITDADQANGIIASGRADLVAIGRPHLTNPAWTLMEAAKFGYASVGKLRRHLLRLAAEGKLVRSGTVKTGYTWRLP